VKGNVVLRNGGGDVCCSLAPVRGDERWREIRRSENLSAPVEMRWQEFGEGRGFDRDSGRRRCRHSGRGVLQRYGMPDAGQDGDERDTAGECPPVTGSPTHQFEVSRKLEQRRRSCRRSATRNTGGQTAGATNATRDAGSRRDRARRRGAPAESWRPKRRMPVQRSPRRTWPGRLL